MILNGHCDPRFQPVAEAFRALFNNPQQRGAALCIQVQGETLVDLWAGVAGTELQQLWQADTLVNLFSCTKTFTAVAALQLVAEGKLALDQAVADYWPEFAQAGKQEVTLRQLLCHSAGLPAIRQALPAQALYDWSSMVHALEAQTPWWTPGSAVGYAPMTYGWLLGELIRRVDGREPGPAILARCVEPLGLDFHIGLDSREFHRVAHITREKGVLGDAPAQRLLRSLMDQPESLTSRAFANPPSILSSGNKPEWRSIQQPAANGHGTARALAGFYTALLQGRLLAPDWLAEMTREQIRGEDAVLLIPSRFGLGCILDQPELPHATYGLGPLTFGHTGAGGSLGCADPQQQLAFGFATNTLGPYVLMDPRAQQLARAAYACL